MNGGRCVLSQQPKVVMTKPKVGACFTITRSTGAFRTMHFDCQNWLRMLDSPRCTLQYRKLVTFRVYFENIYLCKVEIIKFFHLDLNGPGILEPVMKRIQTA